jgi:hypothetical protein
MSNRVEELEAKVSELQAAVDGLTEELVETKERVRQLESQVDVGVDAAASGDTTETGGDDAAAESGADTTPDVGSEVVDEGAEGSNDESKGTEDEGSNDEAESDGSDIIVA